MRNVAAVAEAAGTSLENAVRLTIFTTDLGAFADINEVYAGFFGDEPPARAAVGVAALPKGALVEIDAVLLARAAGREGPLTCTRWAGSPIKSRVSASSG